MTTGPKQPDRGINKPPQTPGAPADRYRALWRNGRPPALEEFLRQCGPLSTQQVADVIRVDQSHRADIGDRIAAEEYLRQFPQLAADSEAAIDVVYAEFLIDEQKGCRPDVDRFIKRFPQYSDILRQQIELHTALSPEQHSPAAAPSSLTLCADRAARHGHVDPGAESMTDSTIRDWPFHAQHTVLQSVSDSSPAAAQERQRDPAESGCLPKISGYEVLAEIARGGVGVVYRARDVRLDRIVAIKMLLTDQKHVGPETFRFAAEGVAAGRLQHPNIVPIFDVGTCDGRPFLVMEYADGGTLAQRFRGQPQPPRKVAELIAVLTRTVSAMHQKGILHRDLKPGNILLVDPQEQASCNDPWRFHPKIADFGMAKVLPTTPGAAETPELTRTGDVLGTPMYMAPEQALGDTANIGPRTDVHALGVMLYELVTGRPPFQGTHAIDTLQQVVHDEPVPPSRLVRGIPKDLETICLRCMEKRPELRYPSAGELAADLERFLAGESIAARPPGPLRLLVRVARRRPMAAAVTLFTTICLMAALAASWWQTHSERQQSIRATVDALLTADSASVPLLIARLRRQPDLAREALNAARLQPELHSAAWFHITLARTEFDPQVAAELVEYVPLAQPTEIQLLVRALAPQSGRVAESLWRRAVDPQIPGQDRLRVACVLAAETPEDPRWLSIADAIVQTLVRENPVDVPRWTHVLQPIRHVLSGPLKDVVLDNPRFSSEQLIAAGVLAKWLRDQPEEMTRLLLSSHPDAYVVLFRGLQPHPTTLTLLQRELKYPADGSVLQDIPVEPAHSTEASAALRDVVEKARRHAIAAVTLARLSGIPESASSATTGLVPASPTPVDTATWHDPFVDRAASETGGDALLQLLEPAADPTARSIAIQLSARLQLSPEWAAARLNVRTSPGALAGLLQLLGEYDEYQLTPPRRSDLQPRVVQLLEHPDTAVHSSAVWLLRRWQMADAIAEQPSSPAGARQDPDSRWLMNSEGQLLSILPAGAFEMGSLPVEEDHEGDELRHPRRIDHAFAIAAHEVTVEQYRKFRPDAFVSSKYSPSPDSPMVNVSFFDAAAYCRWLSEREGTPESEMCFPSLDHIMPGMQIPDDYAKRSGYRLPTEDEWEYACRGGTVTAWSFGLASELIDSYAQCTPHSNNQALPVGRLKPNEYGLFDLHGNAAEWCVNPYRDYDPSAAFDTGSRVLQDELRVIRGGYFGDFRFTVRSARRNAQPAAQAWASTGFRVVKTVR